MQSLRLGCYILTDMYSRTVEKFVILYVLFKLYTRFIPDVLIHFIFI